MTTVNVGDILRKVFGFRGLPFPATPDQTPVSPIAGAFKGEPLISQERSRKGTPLWGKNALGRPVFMPAKLNGYELPNPLITITGEKNIIETEVFDKGTVFEKVFTKPYDITIICTLINADDTWPEEEVIQMKKLFTENDLYTLECALTDIFLQPRNNFILTRIDLLDMQGVENAQVIQLAGRSNIDFELTTL
jgi:hypothetical protein